MAEQYFDVDAALKEPDTTPAEIAAHLAQLHNVDRDAYLKEGLSDDEFLKEFKNKPLPGTMESKPVEQVPAVSNATNAAFGIAGAAIPTIATGAFRRLMGTQAPAPAAAPAPAKPAFTYETPEQVRQRILASGQPARPEGPADVVNWAMGKDPKTGGQYGRGYLGGTSMEHEADLHRQADALEAKNPGYKVKQGTSNLLIPQAEYDRDLIQKEAAQKAATADLSNQAKMAAELRAQRLAQIQPTMPSKIASAVQTGLQNAAATPALKRGAVGYNVGDYLQAQNPFEKTVSAVGAGAPVVAAGLKKVLPARLKPIAELIGTGTSLAAPAINYLERKFTAPAEPEQHAAGGQIQGYAGGKLVQQGLSFLERNAPEIKNTISRAISDFDPRFDKRANELPKLQNMVVHTEQTGAQNIPKINLTDFEGKPFITSMSDRTAAGSRLLGLNDTMFKRPVDLKGGQDFMFNNPGQVWASAKGPVRQIMDQASAIRDFTGQSPLYIPWQMAPTGSDFAHMTGQTMLANSEANMGRQSKKQLDSQIKQFIPDWKGVDHPDSISQFTAAPSPIRKAIQATIDKNFRDEGALGIGEARLAIADPRQLTTPEGSIFNVGQIHTDSPMVMSSGHESYPFGVPGEGLGQVDKNINIYQALPKAVKERGIADPTNPSVADLRALQMKPYAGILTEDVLRNMGYAEGGHIEGYGGGGKIGILEGIANLAKKFLPDAGREANLAKYLENSKVQTPMYHGTSADITQFKPGTANATFVTSNPDFAGRFSYNSLDNLAAKKFGDLVSDPPTAKYLYDTAKELSKKNKTSFFDEQLNVIKNELLPAGPNVMQVHVNAQNPFDYENPEHINNIVNELNKSKNLLNQPLGDSSRDVLSRGSWSTIELPEIQNAIKNLGHDSFYVKEGGEKNLGLYDPAQIKSATGNVGTFDPTNPDITKKAGGEVKGYDLGGAVKGAGKLLNQIPEVAHALEQYLRGNISNAERLAVVNKYLPTRQWSELPPAYTDEQIRNALMVNKQPKALADVPVGMRVGNRLDIPAYTQNGVYVDTVHALDSGNTPISYNRTGHLTDVDFSSKPNQAARVGLGTKEQALTPLGAEMGSGKSPFALIKGTNVGTSDDEVRRMMQEYLKDPNWTQIGMDPRKGSQFYDKSTNLPVFSAEQKLQSGPLVLVPKQGLETTHWQDPRLQLSDERLMLSNPEEGLHYKEGGHATPAWQRSEGKNPEGGLNALGRASYNREHGAHLKAPQPEGGSRRDSFCARMTGMREKLTSSETAKDPDSRINKALKKWNC